MVYSRVYTSTLGLHHQVFFSLMLSYSGPILHKTGALFNPPNLYFTLDSKVNEDPPEFTITCVSKGGPATLVVWSRNGEVITENSTYSTSQIIVDTSSITVYNNTLRVRGREGGVYRCTANNSQSVMPATRTLTVLCKLFGDVLFTVNYMLNQIHRLLQISLLRTSHPPLSY